MKLSSRQQFPFRARYARAPAVARPVTGLAAAELKRWPNHDGSEDAMSDLPNCPKCSSSYTYEDRDMYVCPECAHEWSATDGDENTDTVSVKDASGNTLVDGDSVTVIKDLKVKGSSSVLKVGTKVKNIRLVEGDHNIACKIDGVGAMNLKSEFVRKA